MTAHEQRRSLYAAQRHDLIVAQARDVGRVDVAELAEQLAVTPETVRRDLTSLERRGLVRRVHGGALPVAPAEQEPSVPQRRERSTAEKTRIAHHALAELPADGVVLLDSGTTTLALAQAWPDDAELTVATNCLAIAAVLADKPACDLHLIGGRIRERTGAAVGAWAEAALRDVVVDVAFLGTNGFSLDWGMTTPDGVEAEVKRAMVAAARRVIVLADASKAGRSHFHRFADVADVSLLITDSSLDEETALTLDAAGMEVARA